MPAFLFATGGVNTNEVDEPHMGLTATASLTAGGTTITDGERLSRFRHVPKGLLVTGSPVQANVVGDALRVNDEVLAATPFSLAFPIRTIQNTDFVPAGPRWFLFWPDSAKKLTFTFEAKVEQVDEEGEILVQATNGVYSGAYERVIAPIEVDPDDDKPARIRHSLLWNLFFGDVLPIRTGRPLVQQLLTITNPNWTTMTVVLDINRLTKTLDNIEGIFSGITSNDVNVFPDHAAGNGDMTHVALSMRNKSGGTISIRKVRDQTSRFLTAETRGTTDLIRQGYYENVDPTNNPRSLQTPDRGFLQVGMVEQNIVGGQPVSPLLLAGLVQNDRSQAALLDIGPFEVNASTSGLFHEGPPGGVDVYLPMWAGRLYLFASLIGPPTIGAGFQVEYRSTVNGIESLGKRARSRNFDITFTNVYTWGDGPATIWTVHLEDTIIPLRGTTVNIKWALQHEVGTGLQKIIVIDGIERAGFSPLPINCVILPPQTNR